MSFINLLDIIYPINSIYMSTDSTSPSQKFGGSWSQINGAMIRGANDINVGGSDTAHSHTIDPSKAIAMLNIQPTNLFWYDVNSAGGFNSNYRITFPSNFNKVAYSTTHGNQVGVKGTTNTSSHLPKYQNLYIWYRTA